MEKKYVYTYVYEYIHFFVKQQNENLGQIKI